MHNPPLIGKRLFLLDMDGTIYLDEQVFDGTVDFLRYVREIGGKYLFLTNNSSRSVSAYIEKMHRLGIATEKDDFLTSVDALILYLNSNGYREKRLYAFGTASFREQLSDAGFRITDQLRDDVQALVCGFDTELTFRKLEDACILLNRGVDFIAANPDWVCPTWYGYVPDCGSVCEMLFRATGRHPRFIGKPQPEMALLAMERYGFSKKETLLIGDRVYTDIACGIAGGVDTCVLFTGEAQPKDLTTTKFPPTYAFATVRDLLLNCQSPAAK